MGREIQRAQSKLGHQAPGPGSPSLLPSLPNSKDHKPSATGTKKGRELQ